MGTKDGFWEFRYKDGPSVKIVRYAMQCYVYVFSFNNQHPYISTIFMDKTHQNEKMFGNESYALAVEWISIENLFEVILFAVSKMPGQSDFHKHEHEHDTYAYTYIIYST